MPAHAPIRAVEGCDRDSWNRGVLLRDGPLNLSAEWVDFVAQGQEATPLFLSAGSEPLAVAYVQRPRRWPLSRWPSAWTDALPLGEDVPGALSAIEALLRQRGCLEFSVGTFGCRKTVELSPFGYEERRRLEFALPLHAGPLDRGFRKTVRHDIRRALEAGVTCRESSDAAGLAAYELLSRDTLDRHRGMGKGYAPSADRTLEVFHRTVLANGRAAVFLAEREAQPLSAAVVGLFGTGAYLVYSASAEEGYRVSASKALLAHVMRELQTRGILEFNLGGLSEEARHEGSPDLGLYKFKSGFGAEERLCISGKKVLRPWAGKCMDVLRKGLRR